MSGFPYTLSDPIERRGVLGLIVLQVDETIEQDFRQLFPGPETALYISRIPSGAELTPDTISQMAHDLPRAAALLPRAARFDAVAYACTSGTTLLGVEHVRDLVKSHCHTDHVCNPLSAALDASDALGLRSIGIVSPYTAAIASPVKQAFENAGIAVPQTLSFDEEIEANVARISPGSIALAAQDLARRGGLDGIFLSCTNLRTLEVISGLEDALGLPVFGSNLALAWSMARAAKLPRNQTSPSRFLAIGGPE